MPTPSPHQIRQQIDDIVGYLLEIGLADDQRFAFQRQRSHGLVEVTFEGADHVSVALRNRSCEEIYHHLTEARAYNVRMPDGALIQMMYRFLNGTLQNHRLAFFPSTQLEAFQNNPQIYLQEEIYADIVARNIVPFPLRFDYDSQEQTSQELLHPKSHLTLGQYENCRIPVTTPITPVRFADFVLRSFYHTSFIRYAESLPSFAESFGESILPSERNVIHVVSPS